MTVRRPAYRWRWFGNRGIVLVLVWSFSAFTVFNYLVSKHIDGRYYGMPHQYRNLAVISTGSMVCPLVGLIADAYIGRYKVIKCCMFLMCGGVTSLCCTYLLTFCHVKVPAEVVVCLTVVTSLAVGGFQVNILTFSTDQLLDSSSNEIISFIIWYAWTYFGSKALVQLLICAGRYFDQEITFGLCLSIFLTLSLTSDALFGHWLVKEPVTPNPLQLIFKVAHYAWKNKYPRHRIACWSERGSSRVDLAKTKYGGPFTTRQVEDVKNFFRILSFVVLGCLFLGLSLQFYGHQILARLSKFQPRHLIFCALLKPAGECLKIVSVTHTGCLLVVVFIPCYEFCLLPFFQNQFQKIRIFTRLLIGAILLFAHLLGLMSVEVVGTFGSARYNYLNESACEGSLNCESSYGDSYLWLMLLSCVHNVGLCLILTAGLEFICAQAPYAMKGMTIGSTYSCLGLSLALADLILLPFRRTTIRVGEVVMGCVFWFLLVSVVCCLLLGIVFLITVHFYKKRRRDEDVDDSRL